MCDRPATYVEIEEMIATLRADLFLRAQVQRLREAVDGIGKAWDKLTNAFDVTLDMDGELPKHLCRAMDAMEEAVTVARRYTP